MFGILKPPAKNHESFEIISNLFSQLKSEKDYSDVISTFGETEKKSTADKNVDVWTDDFLKSFAT